MTLDSYDNLRCLLASTRFEDLQQGLNLIEAEIARVGSGEAKPLFEMLSSLFYIDALDHPELMSILDKAVSLTVGFGSWVIPMLVEKLDAADMKARWVAAHVLGRIGADAIGPLIKEYTSTTDMTLRAFIMYALGKIRSPKIVEALVLAMDAAKSPDLELRDTATRSIGRFMEVIPAGKLSVEWKKKATDCLRGNLSDSSGSVRAKAIRSLGKMARYGHCNEDERAQLKKLCQHILGTDADGDWDRAYVVRKEALEALQSL